MPHLQRIILSLILCSCLGGGASWAGAPAAKGARPARGATVVLRNPRDVRKASEATGVATRDEGWIKTPALAADSLYIRGLDINSAHDPRAGDRNHILRTYALSRAGAGRWFTFVGGHDLIERVLVAGQFAAGRVFRDIGYGPRFQCQASHFYWLVVFRQRAAQRPLPGVYENLQPWFRRVYAAMAPRISQSVQETLQSQRFWQLTGCPVDEQGYFDSRNLDQCKAEFSTAVKALWANNRCPNPQALKYRPREACPTDAVLRSFGRDPGELELRAYLYAAASFNEFFTGYGYTANAYDAPIVREYWTDNAWIRDLPQVELLNVQCGDATTATTGDAGQAPHAALVESY